MELEKVSIRRIIGPTPSGAAVLLGNDEKTFVVFVGFYEAAALIREINNETPARPLTHDLMQNVFLGFDVEVKKVIVSTIIENTFCATLILQQKVPSNASGEDDSCVDWESESEGGDADVWVSKRNEVRIDARPSDCLVLALKNKVDIYVTREVFDQVQDVSNMTTDSEGDSPLTMESLEFDFNSKLSLVQDSLESDAMETMFNDTEEEIDFDEPSEDDDDSAFGGGRQCL